jgi:hypothetical protein
MSDHVISAIKAKRDEIIRQISEMERRLHRLRSSLASLEAAGAILAPDHGSQFRKRRSRYFARNELSRLALDALRKASAPLSLAEIAIYAMKTKAIPPSAETAVKDLLFPVLRNHVASGRAIRTGQTRDARWSLTPP